MFEGELWNVNASALSTSFAVQFLGPVFRWGLNIWWADDDSWNYFLCPWSDDFGCKAVEPRWWSWSV